MMTDTLWNSEDCASFFRRSVDRFLTDIRSLPDFPPPIILPTGKARQSRPLWEPDDVRQFARNYKRAA